MELHTDGIQLQGALVNAANVSSAVAISNLVVVDDDTTVGVTPLNTLLGTDGSHYQVGVCLFHAFSRAERLESHAASSYVNLVSVCCSSGRLWQ